MQNIQLNPGGVIGAILLMAIVIAVVILTCDPDTAAGRAGMYGVIGVFIGAAGGNYLWERLFPKKR